MEMGKTNLDFFLQKRMKEKQPDFSTQELLVFMKQMLAAHCHL